MSYRHDREVRQFKGFPYVFEHVGGDFIEYYEARSWCQKEFGLTQQNMHWWEMRKADFRWSFCQSYIVFRDEQDAFWFKIRWC